MAHILLFVHFWKQSTHRQRFNVALCRGSKLAVQQPFKSIQYCSLYNDIISHLGLSDMYVYGSDSWALFLPETDPPWLLLVSSKMSLLNQPLSKSLTAN